MKTVILILSITLTAIYSQTVSFKETKFVEALELYTYRDGNVTYSNEKTIVSYKDGKTIIKQDNNLTVRNRENELLTTIDLNKKPDVALYFTLTKSIFSKDFDSLKEGFEIKKPKTRVYSFIPKGETKKVIKGIALYLKEDESIEYFQIKFTNGDDIKIEAK